MKYFDNPIPNLSYIVDHLHPGIDFRLQDDSDGFGPYPTQNLDQMPTEAELNAAESAAMLSKAQDEKKAYASLVSFQRASDYTDPLTGLPISNASDRSTIEHDLVKAESYWIAAYPTADAVVQSGIDAAKAERERVTLVTLTIHGEIDAVTDINNLPTDGQIKNDSRWNA